MYYRFGRWVVVGLCQYEVVALNSGGRLPSLSQINDRLKQHGLPGFTFGIALVLWLAIHLFAEERVATLLLTVRNDPRSVVLRVRLPARAPHADVVELVVTPV